MITEDISILPGDQICFNESDRSIFFLRRGKPIKLPEIDLDVLDELVYYKKSVVDILKLIFEIFGLIATTDKKPIREGIRSYTLI